MANFDSVERGQSFLDGLAATLSGNHITNPTAPAMHQNRPQKSSPSKSESEGNTWPRPQLLAAKVDPEPYPLDALPESIRAAVEEVTSFVKAPVPLVASSALSSLSLAGQAHIDVKRAEKLQSPVSLFLLTIADSGERKSTCDGFFSSAIRQYQEEQSEAIKPRVKDYQTAIAAWEAEYDGILSAVKEAGKKGNPTDKLRADLTQLQQDKPEPPRVPRLILGDETPENLAWSLAKLWPSSGVLSSEAGVVFGSHGMGRDSAMRNLALLNVLWDGGAHSIGRRTSESFTVRGARLTMGLMIQEATLREYFNRSGGLARGTGFLDPYPDDRRTCWQCQHLRGRVCSIARPGGLVSANRGYRPPPDTLQRCAGYLPNDSEADQQPGRERWPVPSHTKGMK